MTFRGFRALFGFLAWFLVTVSRLESTMINLMLYVDVVGALCEQHQHVEVPVTFFYVPCVSRLLSRLPPVCRCFDLSFDATTKFPIVLAYCFLSLTPKAHSRSIHRTSKYDEFTFMTNVVHNKVGVNRDVRNPEQA
jgi:hypothetical protein